jgi:hypothetical protein
LKTDTSPADEPGLPSAAPFEVPTYDTAPGDQPYVDRVLSMDPVRDVPGPATLKGDMKVPAKFTLAMLPQGELREQVERRLRMVPPSKYEESQHEFVREALYNNSLSVRASMGVSSEALPYWKEMADIAAEGRQAVREFDRLALQINEVARHETRLNEATGDYEPVPVMRLEGDGRTAALRRMEELSYKLKLLEGIEGERRLKRAMLATVELMKRREAQAADQAEVARRVEAEEREARINQQVQTKLRMRGVEVKP